MSNTCTAPAPTCTPPASSSTSITRTLANENVNVGCPAGYSGEHWQTRSVTENGTRTTSWTCPGPTSSTNDTWLGTYNYGAWTTTSNTCTALCVSSSQPFVVTSIKLDLKAGYTTASGTTLGQIVHISNSSRYTMTAKATITGTFNGTTYTATISTGQTGMTTSTGSCSRYTGATTGASAGCSGGGSLPPGQDAEVFMANATQSVVYLKSRACP